MVIIVIGIGIVGEGFIVLVVLLEKCIKKVIVFICVDMIVIMFLLIVCEYSWWILKIVIIFLWVLWKRGICIYEVFFINVIWILYF